jgi:GNAT superfamily N-acetyltransferase
MMSEEGEEIYEFHLLTPERWDDFEKLFGRKGASSGCWCMWWLVPRSEFRQMNNEGHRQAMKTRVESGSVPGMLAYSHGEAVGWCAFGPREMYPAMDKTRFYQRVDAEPVWSVVCFYVAKKYRRLGLTTALLQAVIDEVRRQGGNLIEGYPLEPGDEGKVGEEDGGVFLGLAPAFRKAGFVEVEQRGGNRVVMRYNIKGSVDHE